MQIPLRGTKTLSVGSRSSALLPVYAFFHIIRRESSFEGSGVNIAGVRADAKLLIVTLGTYLDHILDVPFPIIVIPKQASFHPHFNPPLEQMTNDSMNEIPTLTGHLTNLLTSGLPDELSLLKGFALRHFVS